MLDSIGKTTDEFLEDRNVYGKTVKAIKKKPNSTLCIFWDQDNKKCSIYKQRPFDCRSYPFDILQINEKYHWIVYSCNPQSNWQWAESYLQMLEQDVAFSEIMENIDVFSGNTSLVLPDESKKTTGWSLFPCTAILNSSPVL